MFFPGGLEGLSERRSERSEGESLVDFWEECFGKRRSKVLMQRGVVCLSGVSGGRAGTEAQRGGGGPALRVLLATGSTWEAL